MSKHIDESYKDMVTHILENGERRSNRTGIDTISVFGYQLRCDLRTGFPLLTTKKVLFSSIVKELIWFLSGSTNIKDLGCGIWDAWANENGDCGPIYGKQWVAWNDTEENCKTEHINQIQKAIDMIKNDPESRRIIVSAWNVAELDQMALNPCHVLFQFNVSGPYLDLQLYQRSADTALGVPFNIASYALLLMIIAKECGLTPRHFIHTFGDLHIYVNHVDGLKEQLKREVLTLPHVTIADKNIWELKEEDIVLEGYQHGKFIKFEVAV